MLYFTISYNIVSSSFIDRQSTITEYSDFPRKMIIEHSMIPEGIIIFFFLRDSLFAFTKKKKDQPFNRKKTRVNQLSEGK